MLPDFRDIIVLFSLSSPCLANLYFSYLEMKMIVEQWGNDNGGEKWITRRKACPRDSLPKISHGLVWDQTRASEVTGRRIIAWHIGPY